MKSILAALALIIVAAILMSQPGLPPQRVGPLLGGRFQLNSGWTLQPAGRQIPLSTLPMSSVLSRDGKYLLVLNGGYRQPSITVLSVADEHEVSQIALPDAWLGMALSRDGKFVYVGGGSQARVYELSFSPEG